MAAVSPVTDDAGKLALTSIMKLAKDIVRRLEHNKAMWQKWTPDRELLLMAAIPCWIPIDHLRDFLNGMSGAQLTLTDVTQRFRALEDEEAEYAHEEFKEGCLAIYEQDSAAGTELPAICGLLRQYIER